MIVEELRVRNWRSYREEQSYAFSEGVNLLVGPNEAGKSTLFEALQRALFDRHGSRARRLVSVQPLGSSLAPEVEVVLRTGGARYRVRKRFLVDPRSELYSDREGRWELDHEGDRADAELRALLGGRPASKGSEARHRGLAQALWYLQRENGLPARAWSDAVHQGLASLVRTTLSDPLEETVKTRIMALRDATFTGTGRLRSASALSALRDEVAELEGELESRSQELQRAELHRQELSELESAREEALRRLAGNRAEGERLVAAAERWSELEQRRERLERQAGEASARSRLLGEAWEVLARREERMRELESRLAACRESEAELQVEVRRLRRSAESHARQWETVLEPRLKVVTAQVEELQARLRLDDLEREAVRLRAVCERRRELVVEERRVREALASLLAPRREEHARLARCAEEIKVLRARIASSAVRLRFELAGKPAIESEPRVESEGGEFLVTSPTTFTLEGVGRLHVRSGDASLEGATRELEERSAELAAGLRRYGAFDLSALEEKVEERRRLEQAERDAAHRLADLDSSDPGMEERLREVERELRHLRERSPQQVLPGIEGWARDRTLEELRDLEADRDRVERTIGEERRSEHEAQRGCLLKDEELREAGKEGERVRAALDALREQIAESLATHGSREGLRRERDEADARLLEAKRALEEFGAEYQRQVERPRERLSQLQSSLEASQRELGRLEAEIADRLGRLDEIARLGLYTQVGDLEGLLESRRQRLAVAGEEAEAVRVLATMVEAFQGAEARELQDPLAEILDPWLRFLTGDRYDGLSLDGELLPVAATLRRYGEPLPLESLSHGTQEQIVVLLRLAMGVLLSREERQLVVLDDRLVNADAARMERLCRILEEAGERCQILLATCSAAPYASLDATSVRFDAIGSSTTTDEAVARGADP